MMTQYVPEGFHADQIATMLKLKDIASVTRHYMTETCPCNMQRFFFSVVKTEKKISLGGKMIVFDILSKNCLWVHVSTEGVLTSTYNPCFGSK